LGFKPVGFATAALVANHLQVRKVREIEVGGVAAEAVAPRLTANRWWRSPRIGSALPNQDWGTTWSQLNRSSALNGVTGFEADGGHPSGPLGLDAELLPKMTRAGSNTTSE
jgi:hypothetical protein